MSTMSTSSSDTDLASTCFFCPSRDVKLCSICNIVSYCDLHRSIHVNKVKEIDTVNSCDKQSRTRIAVKN